MRDAAIHELGEADDVATIAQILREEVARVHRSNRNHSAILPQRPKQAPSQGQPIDQRWQAPPLDAVFHRFAAAELKVPAGLPRIRHKGTMSYVLARHRLGLEYTDVEVDRSLRSFLKRNVYSKWLSRGQYDTAARWMKVAHWKPGDDPIATLQKCYDSMEQCEAPQYP